MCGLAFSGKPTLARAISARVGAEYVGLDAINEARGLCGGEGIPGHEWDRTSLVAVERLGRVLGSGRDVVLDDTLCFRWLRARYVEAARRHAAEFVLIYVSTPLSEIYAAMARTAGTRQRAPIAEDVFREHARSFEVPSVDEGALVFSRDVPVDEWLARHVSTQD